MTSHTNALISADAARDLAKQLVLARRRSEPLANYPGPIPDSLASAYRIQDCAIELWPDQVAGWKVGRLPPAFEDQFGIDRLAGPVFATTIRHADSGDVVEMPVFDGGFAAVEAEYVAVIASDAPIGKTDWSVDDAANMVTDLRIGIEIASSPLPTINDLGPTVVASDFGNNGGLIVGPSMRDWATRNLDTMVCDTFINEKLVGSGGAFKLTGGFIRSVQFMLELAATRGRPLRQGDLVATGQTTGIHDVRVGQTSRVDFGDDGELACLACAAVSSA